MSHSIKPKKIEYNPAEAEMDCNSINLTDLQNLILELTPIAVKIFIYCLQQKQAEEPSIDCASINSMFPMSKATYHRGINELVDTGHINLKPDGNYFFSFYSQKNITPSTDKTASNTMKKPITKTQWVYDF